MRLRKSGKIGLIGGWVDKVGSEEATVSIYRAVPYRVGKTAVREGGLSLSLSASKKKKKKKKTHPA
jgi:hypothetical protein